MRQYKTILLLTVFLCLTVKLSDASEAGDVPVQQTPGHNSTFSLFTAPSIKLLSEYFNNSSDFSRTSAGAELGVTPSTGSYLGTGYVFSDFSQDGFDDISRHTVFIQGEKMISESTGLTARVSGNFYDNDNSNLNGGVSVRYWPAANLFTELSYRHFDLIDTVLPFNNIIYSYVVTIGSLDRNIRSDDYKFFILYDRIPKVSFASEFIYGDYSDSNRKLSFMFDAGYQLLDTPYLRTAYNYFYLDIKDPAPLTRGGDHVESAYWDPVNFETHTLRLEYRQDFREHLSFGAEGALSYSPKSGGLSKSVFLYTSYGFTERSSLRFDVRWFDQNKGIDRLGETDRYWAANYTIAFQHRF